MEKQYRLLPALTGLFVATLLISSNLDTKFFHGFGMDWPAGVILFPLVYVFGDILTEVYGYAAARRTIWTGFASQILMVLSYEVARALPPSDFWQNQAAFDAIFSHVPRIVLASIMAYLSGEFVNSAIVAKMKVAQKGRQMGVRFVVSTIGGQAVDTAVFVPIAFAGTMTLSAMLAVFLSAWAFKVVWEVIALPITIPLVRFIKRYEKEDVYDKKTNLNPFKIFG